MCRRNERWARPAGILNGFSSVGIVTRHIEMVRPVVKEEYGKKLVISKL